MDEIVSIIHDYVRHRKDLSWFGNLRDQLDQGIELSPLQMENVIRIIAFDLENRLPFNDENPI